MNLPSSIPSNSLTDSPDSVASVVAVAPAVSTAVDRLYQIAALTAGIFLLATLL